MVTSGWRTGSVAVLAVAKRMHGNEGSQAVETELIVIPEGGGGGTTPSSAGLFIPPSPPPRPLAPVLDHRTTSRYGRGCTPRERVAIVLRAWVRSRLQPRALLPREPLESQPLPLDSREDQCQSEAEDGGTSGRCVGGVRRALLEVRPCSCPLKSAAAISAVQVVLFVHHYVLHRMLLQRCMGCYRRK